MQCNKQSGQTIYTFLLGILCVLLHAQTACAQYTAGATAYDFLKLSPSAHVTALGGQGVAMLSSDPAWAYQNPALLNDSMHKQLQTSVAGYIANITVGNASYAQKLNNAGWWHVGTQFINYGSITQTDEYGNTLGTLNSAEVALFVGVARKIGPFHVGTNIKLISSNIAHYTTWGAGIDFGTWYHNPRLRLSVGTVIRNAGSQFASNVPNAPKLPLPLEWEMGLTHKINHAPFRVSVTASNLLTLQAISTTADNSSTSTLNNIARRFTFGLEILFHKAFEARLGYNLQRRSELARQNEALTLSGFSWGAVLKYQRVNIAFGYSTLSAAGGFSQVSLGYRFGAYRSAAGK